LITVNFNYCRVSQKKKKKKKYYRGFAYSFGDALKGNL